MGNDWEKDYLKIPEGMEAYADTLSDKKAKMLLAVAELLSMKWGGKRGTHTDR